MDTKMRTKNILLADDNENYLYILSIIFESKGIKTTKATNGIKAVKILEQRNFDMLITDFNMPVMNGIELAMKAKKLHPDIYIIMITGGLSSDVVEMAANAGISQMLSKPVNALHLLATIRSVLRIR